MAGQRGLPTEDVWERPEVGEGLAKPAQSYCVARSAWPPVPPVGLAGVVQPVLPPGPRSRSSRSADKDAGEGPTLPRHLVPATFQQPVPATFWRRSGGRWNVARTSPAQVVGTSPEQWKTGTVPRAQRAHCVHYGPVRGGGGASTWSLLLPDGFRMVVVTTGWTWDGCCYYPMGLGWLLLLPDGLGMVVVTTRWAWDGCCYYRMVGVTTG